MLQNHPYQVRVSFYPGKIALWDLQLITKVFLLLCMQEYKKLSGEIKPQPMFYEEINFVA